MGFLDFAQSAGGGSLIGSTLSAVGSYINGKRSQDTAREQMAMQREFAQNGIRWRVTDAKEAGIHPLAALGAQTVSYSPVAVGDDGLGSALQQMGQGISRAVEAKQLQEEREAAQARQEMEDVFNTALRQKQLERLDLENDVIRQQLKASQNVVTTSALPPPMPKVNADDRLSSSASISSGVSPLLGAARIGDSILLHINPDIADSITEDFIRNQVANIAAEGQIGRIFPEIVNKFTKAELDAIRRGDAELLYTPPSQIKFAWKPHMRPRYVGNKQTVRGKIIF